MLFTIRLLVVIKSRMWLSLVSYRGLRIEDHGNEDSRIIRAYYESVDGLKFVRQYLGCYFETEIAAYDENPFEFYPTKPSPAQLLGGILRGGVRTTASFSSPLSMPPRLGGSLLTKRTLVPEVRASASAMDSEV